MTHKCVPNKLQCVHEVCYLQKCVLFYSKAIASNVYNAPLCLVHFKGYNDDMLYAPLLFLYFNSLQSVKPFVNQSG